MILPTSRPHPRLAWRVGTLALGLLATACAARAAIYTALSDAISYASWNVAAPQMDDVWSANTGVTPVLASGYFTLGNGVIHKTLPVTATQNFEVRADVLHGAYQRSLWVGLFNSAGTQGYAFLWNSSTGPDPAQGLVSVRKYTVAGPASLLFNTYGTVLGGAVASGHAATTGSTAQLKLTWTAATSTLALSVDGVVKSTVVDSSYASFSRIFIAGNDSAAPSRFDNVTVTSDDSTAPAVSLTAPSAGATVSGIVSLSASASDVGLGVAGVQFKLNNVTNIGAEDTSSSYGVSWNTTALENGVYQLTAVARDHAGNLTTSAPLRVFVKNTSTAGAVLHWTSYEAEDATRHANATLQTGTTWGATSNQASFEARGKQCVLLDASGENVVWNNVVAANRLTVRYSMASEASSGTLSLYVNGGSAINLPVTGARTREPKPGAMPGETVRFWDEVMVPVTIPNNATVELRYNNVACNIDFMELETAPAALSPPDSTWVSVASGTDDARARIVAAFTTASGSGGSKKVWFPAGTYTVEMGRNGSGVLTPSETIKVPSGTEMRGAGIWHTKIVKNWGGPTSRLFSFYGKTGIIARDMQVVDTITTLSGNDDDTCLFIVGTSTNCVLQNIWTEYGTLASAYNSTNLVVRDCRVRNGYKDAIHIANGSQGGLIENCTFRNAGDDCAAFVMYELTSPVALNSCTARYNTMEGTYWGRSVSLQGGDNILAEYNLARDSSMAGIMVAIGSWKKDGVDLYWPHNTNFTVRNNLVIRCGNQMTSNAQAALSVGAPSGVSRPMSGTVTGNTVLDSPFHASQLVGRVGDATHQVLFQNNNLELPTTSGGPPWARKHLNLPAYPSSNCIHTPNTEL